MFEWEDDNFSFEDSDRFEEDSICSWISEPESVVNNWRGWRKNPVNLPGNKSDDGKVPKLLELAAKEAASSIPFELVEQYPQPIPEDLQLRIAFWSFPEQEEDIRLYSCLANGSADEFVKGEHMLKSKAVKDPLQIGFHLSATILPGSGKPSQSTSVTFDRKRIVTCQCSCNPSAEWCAHVVALCLHRIHQPSTVKLRVPVSESLNQLDRSQLQKFAQYLIAELPQQILPTAQTLLDDLLSKEDTDIKLADGGPDPTIGGEASEQPAWYLDGKNLKDNIKKILIKFCVPAPIVFSDVNYLSTTAPPSASEWCSYLRPLRGREPEGMWNLLSIVREMFRRNDGNSIPLLEIITQQCLETVQIMVWWFNTKVALSSARGPTTKQVNSNSQASQNACSSLCDEIVTLWKLAALNPCISPKERSLLKQRLKNYHDNVIEKIQTNQTNASAQKSKKTTMDLELFPGFKPAIEACMLDWEDYPIPDVTFGHNSHYLTPFAVFKLNDGDHSSQITSSPAVLRCEYPGDPFLVHHHNKQASEQQQQQQQQNQDEEAAKVSLNSSETGNNSDEGVGGDEEKNDDDNYEVYYFDPKESSSQAEGGSSKESSSKNSELDVFRNLRTLEHLNRREVLLMRAEGINAHGYHSHACQMAVSLAEDLLKDPPELTLPTNVATEATGAKGKKKRIAAASHSLTHNASTTLAHCAFLCTVLSEVPEYQSLAFRVGMFGIQMTRLPASTKPMEVKLAHQESELVNLLKKIPLGSEEIGVLREKARDLRDGTLRLRGEALLPMMLASYIFESLVTSHNSLLNKTDEQLGFEAAVAAIGLKANVSEADHPLLCEGTRRQRGDLALLLLANYKDTPQKLREIIEKLLDKDIHQLFKSPIQTSYYQTNRSLHGALRNLNINAPPPPQPAAPQVHVAPQHPQGAAAATNPANQDRWQDWESYLNPPTGNHHVAEQPRASVPVNRSTGTGPGSDSGSSGNSSADSMDSSSSSKNAKYPHEYSPDVGSSHSTNATGGTSNAQANLPMHQVMGAAALHTQPPMRQQPHMPHEMSNLVRTSLPNIKVNRFKGRKAYPTSPNQPSEALAHFMFELAKQVLTKAGGNSSTSLFTQPSANQNHRGPHRALHMCAFQIGLYALGLHNRVSPNWLSRTYSSHVSWITGQADQIGASAIHFLMGTWEGHLTPPEAASMADKASKSRDTAMIKAAADLALSVLPHAAALNQNEIQRGIQQCKEESDAVLEKACEAVEKAARGGGVYPDVMFEVAKHWYDLYNKNLPLSNAMTTPPPQAPPPSAAPSPGHEALMAMAAATGGGPYSMPFPTVYGLIPGIQGFQPGHPAGGAPLQMYVPQAAAVQLAAAVTNAATVTTVAAAQQAQNNMAAVHAAAAARFNFAAAAASGQQLYHFAPPGAPLIAPLIGAPPPQLQPAVSAAAFSLQHAAHAAAAQAMHTTAMHSLQHPPPVTQAEVVQVQQPQVQQNVHQATSQHYLISAYRVGMLALECLGRRVSEERIQFKFARNPNYGDDVRWLLGIATKLGLPYLQIFLDGVLKSVMTPFLLQDLAYETGKYFAQQSFPGLPASQNPTYTVVVQQLRANHHLQPLVNRCYECYHACFTQKLHYITPPDYDEFVSTLKHAKSAFYWTQQGIQAFHHLLGKIKQNKACRRELWQKIEMSKQDTLPPH